MEKNIHREFPEFRSQKQKSLELSPIVIERKKKEFIKGIEKEIDKLIETYSAKNFEEIKKRYTKYFTLGDKETYKRYPVTTFRTELAKQIWFKNLDSQHQDNLMKEIDLVIANYIHQRVQEKYGEIVLTNFVSQNVKDKEIMFFFINNMEIKIKKGLSKNEKHFLIRQNIAKLTPKQKEEIYQLIENFKKYFGFYPGDPATLDINCVAFRVLTEIIYRHYGFDIVNINALGHTLNMIYIGKDEYISDVNLDNIVPFSQYVDEYQKLSTLPLSIYSLSRPSEEEDAATFNNVAIFYKNLGKLKKAERLYKKAIKINQNYPEAHNNLGSLLVSLERPKEAEKEFREAVRISPKYAEAHNNLGHLMFISRRYEEAEKEFREAIRINPTYAEPHNNLGSVMFNLKRYEEAEKELREAIRINPNYAEAHNNLGRLLVNLGRLDEAEKEFKEAVKINKNYIEAYNSLAFLYIQTQNKDKARETILKIIELLEKEGSIEGAKEYKNILNKLNKI